MESAICPALFDPPCPCSPPGHETFPGPAGGGIPWCTGSGTGPAICRPQRPARTSRFSRARARGQSKECRPSGGSYPCPKSHWSGLQRRRGRGVEVQLGGEGFHLHLPEHAQRLQKTTLRRHGAKPSSGAEIARARAVPLMSVRAQCCCTQPARATCWLAKAPARACGHCPCRGSAATRRHAYLTNPASPPSITTLVRCDCQLFSGLILDRAAFKGTGAFSPSLPASLLFPLERARWPQFHMTLHDGSQASTRLTMMLPRSQFPP